MTEEGFVVPLDDIELRRRSFFFLSRILDGR
jgi:hypothetical protein